MCYKWNMKHVRWYDKNPELKEVFEFIQSLDKEHQKTIASDIIQILASDFGLDMDEKINTIVKQYDFDCQRWYDEDINLFSSFEIIKGLSKEMQTKVVKKIIETILFIYYKEGAND